jgi:hypothetical protein
MTLDRRLPAVLSAIALLIILALCVGGCTPTQSPAAARTDIAEAPSATRDTTPASPVAQTSESLMPTEDMIDPTPTVISSGSDTAAQPPTSAPTSTPPPPPTAPACGPGDPINARYVEDLGIADGTQIPPGATFPKSWRLENSGSCAWPAGTELVHIAGDPLTKSKATPIQTTQPGEEAAICVTFVAPIRSGHYTSYWRLRAPEIGLFGAVVFVEINVSPDAPPPEVTPTPAATPTPTPTRLPTHTATPEATTPPATTCYPPDPGFYDIINQATPLGIHLQCAVGPAHIVPGEVQAFWLDEEAEAEGAEAPSLMILREDVHRIYALVVRNASTYGVQIIPYDATQPINPDAGASAYALLDRPEGPDLITGRIGETWCDLSLWATVGWPREPAASVSLKIQETKNGALIQIIEGEPTSLIAIDFNRMRATTR